MGFPNGVGMSGRFRGVYLQATITVMLAGVLACSGSKADDAQDAKFTEEIQPARPTPRPDLDYRSIMGVARPRADGQLCIAMPAPLEDGAELTLVSVPVALPKADSTPTEYSSVVASRVTGRGANECSIEKVGHGLSLPGDSLYTAAIVRDTARSAAIYFAVALPFRAFFRAGHTAAARLSEEGHVLNFRICASGEGLHLTAWDGKPLTGKRVWHCYYYLGYDMIPSCVEGDVG